MHIADILSKLAGKDLEPSDQLIPISFNVHTRSTRPLKQYYANKQKTSIPYKSVTPKATISKPLIQPMQPKCPPKISVQPPKPTMMSKTPPGPQSSSIPQSLPLSELPPPQSKETIEMYRPPDKSLYHKPLPILKDAEELDVFTRHIPKQTDIDKFLQILKAKFTKLHDLSVTATELVKEYPHSPAFSSILNYITQNVLPKDKRSQRMVIANAENYIVVNGILFKLVQQKKVFDTSAKCLLVVPEKFENSIFHMFHDTLLGAHYGPVNTYYNMFEKLQRYISSCEACQPQKQKRGKIPYSHPRIPLSYNPMSYISADIKYIPKGIYDYEFLLIAVCEITGFVIAIPLIKHDAVSIAHALIDRIFLIFGPPKSLIVDEDRALSSKVMHYVLDALKIDIKCISPYNHGSLKTERYIQTINSLITRHLKDKGKEWPLFVTSCCFAMNTFVSTTTGFSSYELVFLKKPPDILNLYFEPLETIAKGYRNYWLKMRAKLDNVSSFIIELNTFQQQRQALERNTQDKKPEIFQKGQLVYLFAPSAVSLQTNTKKCHADFVGPLVINRVLDETHYILSDLQGRILCGVCHVR